jgi:hypothetical protein
MCERAARSFHFPANACDKVGEVLASPNFRMVSLSMGRVLPLVYVRVRIKSTEVLASPNFRMVSLSMGRVLPLVYVRVRIKSTN